MNNKHYPIMIPDIYNYCDRWCERCSFIQACAIGSKKTYIKYNNPREEPFDEDVSGVLQTIYDIIQDISLENHAETPIQSEGDTIKHDIKVVEVARLYTKMVNAWFEKNTSIFEDKSLELIEHIEKGLKTETETIKHATAFGECYEIIQWYINFIYIKFCRATTCKSEVISDEKQAFLQSDSNGSAKIALLAAEKSLAAWVQMMYFMPDKADDMLDILGTLQKIIRLGDAEFPDARAFKRAGFDTPSPVFDIFI